MFQIVPLTDRPFSTAEQINYAGTKLMGLQKFHTADLYSDFLAIKERWLSLNCSDGLINFSCDFIFNVVEGYIKSENKMQAESTAFSREKKHYRRSMFKQETLNQT